MAILNVTYGGRSADVPWEIDDRLSDAEVKRAVAEAMREHALRAALKYHGDERPDFRHFVVDRIHGPDGVLRLYLRPRVPFGC